MLRPKFFSSIAAFVLAIAAAHSFAMAPKPSKSARTTTSFDADWRFLKGNAEGAEKLEFDDSTWRTQISKVSEP